MPRRRRTNGKGTSERAQETTGAAEVAAGSSVANHEVNVLGLSNVTRRFVLNDPTNGPSAVFDTVSAFDTWSAGWSKDPYDGTNNDPASGVNPDNPARTGSGTSADPFVTIPYYPQTLYADYWLTDVYPVLDNLFTSGVGARAQTDSVLTYRHQAMLIHAYNIILDVLVVNRLAFHFEWSKVFPFTDAVPKYIYDMSANLRASDSEVAQIWLPLIKRFESKTMFPRILAEIKRLRRVRYSVDLNGRLHVPCYRFPLTADTLDMELEVRKLLDFVEVDLRQTDATLTTFLPFPMVNGAPWDVFEDPAVDVNLDSGHFNSGLQTVPAFGTDAGVQPNDKTNLVISYTGENDPGEVIWYSRHTQPTWAEVRHADVYQYASQAPAWFARVTPHFRGNSYITADDFQFFVYDGDAIAPSSEGFRYIDYVNSRFASSDIDHGVIKPGYVGSLIDGDAIRRNTRVQVEYDWNLSLLREISRSMMGNSLREIRTTIASIVYRGMRSPV